ncbi:acyl-CoA dehydrogenase family protein [Hydrogenophaga sp. OTU3427]|uniref:acyl-CoA dehydrogenase family protein n=1 Tax=Hydrogenophaga sp. OTU3427 TaxID=3043856 RepID=UPI00313BBAE1
MAIDLSNPVWPFVTEEQREAVDAFAKFCRNEIQPMQKLHRGQRDLPRGVLQPLLRKMIPFGLGNGRWPAADGGLGLDPLTAGLLYEAGVQNTCEIAQNAFINESVGLILSRFGSEAVKRKYLAPLGAGECIAASANTEASGGSDVSAVKTRATRKGSGYVISGRKVWITNGQYADFVTVLARSVETGQLDLYVVDRKEHGFDATPLETMGSISTAELAFDDIEVPQENRLGTDGKGLGAMLAQFQEARTFVALSAVGHALAAQEAAIAYARERTQFGAPIGAKQLIQAKLADSQVEIDAARLLCYRALELARQGRPCALEASMAKLYATEAAQRVVDRAVQVHGGYGLSPEFGLEKLYRKAREGTVVEGTSEIQRLVIGKALTGLSAF